jgi:hypothetical protein
MVERPTKIKKSSTLGIDIPSFNKIKKIKVLILEWIGFGIVPLFGVRLCFLKPDNQVFSLDAVRF